MHAETWGAGVVEEVAVALGSFTITFSAALGVGDTVDFMVIN